MKNMLNKIAIIFIAIFLLLINTPPSPNLNDEIKEKTIKAAAPSKPTGTTGSYTVEAKANPVEPKPAVYWTQLDDLSFRAEKDGGYVNAKNSGSNTPIASEVNNTIDLSKYTLPSTFRGDDGNSYTKAELNELYLKSDSVRFKKNIRSFEGISLTFISTTKFKFITKTGSPLQYTDRIQYGKNPKGQSKYTVRYDTPVDVIWYGKAENKTEMRVVEDSTLTVGATKAYKAQVRTKKGMASWSTWRDVSAYQWTSDKSSVASVSSNGQVTAASKGDAKITARWKDDNFHLQASATIKVTAEDALSVTGKLDACFKDGTTTLKATLYKAGGKSSDVSSIATWTSSDTSVATVSNGVVTFKKVGSTTIKATSEGKTESVKVTVVDCTVAPPPTSTDPTEPAPAPPPANDPPTAEIEGPTKVIVGETVCYKAIADDPDGVIELYEWDEELDILNSATKDENTICGSFKKVGEEHLIVKVRDDGNEFGEDKKWAYDVLIVTVVTPKPTAYVTIGGTLKENRKMTARVADAYNGNIQAHEGSPIVKQTLTIEAVEESNKSKVFIKESITGNVTPSTLVNFLAKFSGEVKITRYVENSTGDNDTFETIIDVIPDLPPIVDFDTPTLIYREPLENEGENAKAKIIIQNNSYSIDGDELNYFEYTLAFDSKNNGSYDDVYIIKSSEYEKNKYHTISNSQNEFQFKLDNKFNLEIVTKRVGKVKIELLGFETFGSGSYEERSY